MQQTDNNHSLPLPSIGHNFGGFGGMGAANMPNMASYGLIATPPLKRRRMETSISPISPPLQLGSSGSMSNVSMNLNANNDNKDKQMSFLSTLLKAAEFVENGEETTNTNMNTNISANEPFAINTNANTLAAVESANNMAMGIPNDQQMQMQLGMGMGTTSNSNMNMNIPVLGGQMNSGNMASNNGLMYTHQQQQVATPMFNQSHVQYVGMPPNYSTNPQPQPQVIYATPNQLAAMMNNGNINMNNAMYQQQMMPVNMNTLAMPNMYQSFAAGNVQPNNLNNNVCFQSFVPTSNGVQQQQMLMTPSMAGMAGMAPAAVQNVNIMQPQTPQTQFVFFMNGDKQMQMQGNN